MTTSPRNFRFALVALFTASALLSGPTEEAAAGLRITVGPLVLTEGPQTGQPVSFSAKAAFPGEEWIGFQWDWGDGTVFNGGITYSSTATSAPTHTFATPGPHTVICTAYHGFKSGQFGVGSWKYRNSRTVTFYVAPSLPLTIGVLTIDGDKIESANKKNTQFRISGNVRVNGGLVIGNPVVVDTVEKTVTLSGTLMIPGAGEYASGLSFLKDVTLDAVTGGFRSVDLPDVSAEFELAGFSAKLENLRIVGSGLEFDFEVKIPRLTQDPSDPEDPPGPNDPIDLSKVFPPAPTPKQLAAFGFKQFRLDAVSPYLHPLGETKATISNVPLGFAGTKFAIDTLEAGIDPSQKRYFGTLKLKLPTDRGIGGTFEIRDGQWEKVGFSLDAKVPFWTFTGVLDAIYIKSMSANLVNLAVLEGQPERAPTLQAGMFDAVSGNVSEPGIVFEWGPATNLLGQNLLTPIKLTGACTFDPFWNVTAAGQLSFFEDVFGDRMKILGAQGSFAAPQDGREGGTWNFRGDLVLDPLFRLRGNFTTSFAPGDFHATAAATGTTLLPPDHWISGIVPGLDGGARWEWRLPPNAVNRLWFQGNVDVPTTYPVLRAVLQGKGVGFSYDFATDTYDWQLIDVYTVTGPARAAAIRTGIVANGAGADGLIVTLQHSAGAGAFAVRRPDGSLLTPAADDNATVDWIAGATTSMYILRSAADGTYSAEFDDATLGTYRVKFFTPRALPTVSVGGVAADVSVGRYETLAVPFSTTGVDAGATVRAYLDDDDAPGGGVLVATGGVSDASLTADVSEAPAGQYRLVVEALGADGPVAGEATGRVTVRDHLALAVTKGSLTDLAKAGADKLKISGTFTFDGPRPDRLFHPDTEALHLTLGGNGTPYFLRVDAGDPAWKVSPKGVVTWKSAKGVKPAVALTLDPVKRRFSVSVTRADFAAAPVNPIHCDLVFGNDAASDTRDWTEKKPGRFVR